MKLSMAVLVVPVVLPRRFVPRRGAPHLPPPLLHQLYGFVYTANRHITRTRA
ncbi:hypothetical protein LCGC14_2381260, partial [marine sediment metagenome]